MFLLSTLILSYQASKPCRQSSNSSRRLQVRISCRVRRHCLLRASHRSQTLKHLLSEGQSPVWLHHRLQLILVAHVKSLLLQLLLHAANTQLLLNILCLCRLLRLSKSTGSLPDTACHVA